MVFWIKRIATILGIGVFFILFFTGLGSAKGFEWPVLASVFARAAAGGFLFRIVGLVIADILLKGIVTDITVDQKCLLDGGLLQQAHSIQKKIVPGGAEMPFTEITQAKAAEQTNTKNAAGGKS